VVLEGQMLVRQRKGHRWYLYLPSRCTRSVIRSKAEGIGVDEDLALATEDEDSCARAGRRTSPFSKSISFVVEKNACRAGVGRNKSSVSMSVSMSQMFDQNSSCAAGAMLARMGAKVQNDRSPCPPSPCPDCPRHRCWRRNRALVPVQTEEILRL
jgi:hypothetical protein